MDTKDTSKHGILEAAAKTIGSAIGTVVAKTGLAEHEKSATVPRKIGGRFQKVEKPRVPRKIKKVAQKKAARKQKAHTS